MEAFVATDAVTNGAMPVLLVTGAPGTGTTVLAKEIGEQRFCTGEPHAVIKPAEPYDVVAERGASTRSWAGS